VQLYLTLGALCGGGVNCLVYTGQSLYLPHWFERRRGLALSIAFSGVGIGSITILPWLQSVIAGAGVALARGTSCAARGRVGRECSVRGGWRRSSSVRR
jgi:MFS family permease